MKRTVLKLFRRLVSIATVVISIAYLSTALIPFIDTSKFWYISILGLGFPVLLFILLALMIYWLVLRSKAWIACLVVLLLGFQQIRYTFAFNVPKKFELAKNDSTLRVMQWNVHSWNQLGLLRRGWKKENTQPEMMNVVRKYNPDVICIEEFFEVKDTNRLPSNIAALADMGFKYYYFPINDLYEEHFGGTAIFSKYPVKNEGAVVLEEESNMDPLTFVDIDVNGNTFRVIAIHLQSVNFDSKQYRDISGLKKGQRPSVEDGRTLLGKLKRGFRLRYNQAQKVKKQIEESPYPVILCGDFNDVPTSGTYYSIRKNQQDAFLQKGIFIGRTFRFISPTLRIDYILPGKNFKVQNFKRITVPYSDHYPLVADLGY